MSALLSVSEELLPIEQIKFRRPLGPRTLTAQVYRATIGSKDYAVKLFLPYHPESLEINRFRLREYNLSDAELEARFYPWRREMRVYQQIDKYIQGPDRQFFPKYYGATKLSRKLCPRWPYLGDNIKEDIPVVILELLDGKEVHNNQYDLQISDSTRQIAQKLYNEDGIDAEYTHIYIHCMEKIEVLHRGRVVHKDIKPDIFMNFASVVIDFSHSWSWEDGKDEPCLDPFSRRQGPRSFETRSKGERDSFRSTVIREHNGEELVYYREPTFRDQVPFLRDCLRCQRAVNEIGSLAALLGIDQVVKVDQEEDGAMATVKIVSTE
ncbi:hypothetical protein V502_08417 [Pseudogymnoascus sp. VKM F-4520 (FW-2644)]|nr:hypothetical protein V502_08417 [Pseudogymnoascus sp. VKM F-4520 (FW-2644)]